jgi:hypothetical protein
MRNLKETGTQITVEQALANEVNYMSTLKCLDGISEEDF